MLTKICLGGFMRKHAATYTVMTWEFLTSLTVEGERIYFRLQGMNLSLTRDQLREAWGIAAPDGRFHFLTYATEQQFWEDISGKTYKYGENKKI